MPIQAKALTCADRKPDKPEAGPRAGGDGRWALSVSDGVIVRELLAMNMPALCPYRHKMRSGTEYVAWSGSVRQVSADRPPNSTVGQPEIVGPTDKLRFPH
jgi:hypothetical protein